MISIGQKKNALGSTTPTQSQSISIPKNSSGFKLPLFYKVSFLVILVIQIIFVILLINPLNIYQQLSVVQVMNRVSAKASVPPTEIPVIAVIGDRRLLPDITELREQNNVTREVYKDAQNGDYVFAYSSKMVIYRASEDRIIYDDDSPQAIFQRTDQALAQSIVAGVKDRSLISQDSTEVPVWYVVNDPGAERQKDGVFFRNVLEGDVVATFQRSNLVVIFRPSTNDIINSGVVVTEIR